MTFIPLHERRNLHEQAIRAAREVAANCSQARHPLSTPLARDRAARAARQAAAHAERLCAALGAGDAHERSLALPPAEDGDAHPAPVSADRLGRSRC